MEFIGKMLLITASANNINNESDFISKAVIAIIGAVAGVILTHLFYKSKLHKEQKVRFENVIGDRIAKALLNIRDLVKYSETIEIYDIVRELEEQGSQLDFLNGGARYLAIFNDWQSYNEFMDKVSETRKKYEKDIDCETALYLVFIQRYLYQLSIYMSEFGNEKLMPALGTIFIFDIQEWQNKFDKVLIKKINSPKYRLESHNGLKWKLKRIKIVEKRWKKSLLQLAIKETPTDKRSKKVWPMLNGFINDIKMNPQNYIQKDIQELNEEK